MDSTNFKIEKFGKYLLVDQIASGGMAVIYKAIAKMTEGNINYFAIKRILPQFSNDDEFISLLHDEAKLMVQLNHPNIVSMVEFGKLLQQYYIAMEFVEGITLKDLVNRVHHSKAVFTIDLATHIIREIAIGLAYAHRKKDKKGKRLHLVHRDVSPANILLSYQGDVKLADFGISKAQTQGHKTQVGIIRGKIGYMSPEQTRSDVEIDQRSDLYSLGIIFYEVLTGIRLFSANTIPEAIKLVREGKIPPPSEIRPDIPKALEKILLKVLHHNRDQRIQSAQDLVDELNEYLVQHAPLGRPIRVSHVDLMGFVKRFYREEIAKASTLHIHQQEYERIFDQPEEHPKDIFYEPSQTFAANPLFELSTPETTVKDAGKLQQQQYSEIEKMGYLPIRDGSGKWGKGSSLTQKEDGKTHTERTEKNKPKWWILTLPFLILLLGLGYFFFRFSTPNSTEQAMQILENPLRKTTIMTNPAGADIWIDGVKTNQVTPANLALNLEDPVVIELQAQGYLPLKKTIDQNNHKELLSYVMDIDPKAQRTAEVSLTTEPSGAQIFIDGTMLDQVTPTTLDLEVGKRYTVEFRKKGFQSDSTTVDVRLGRSVEKNIFLRKIPEAPKPKAPKPKPKVSASKLGSDQQRAVKNGLLNLITVPWSYVYINGKKIQETPLINFSIQAGEHTIRLENEVQNLKPHTMKITVSEGKRTVCTFNFADQTHRCRVE